MVVQVVHDLVRDTLAQLVGSIISWAAEAIFSLGLATPVIVEQVTTRVSALATKVGCSVSDVITSAKSLKNLLEALQDLLTRLGKDLRTKLPGTRSMDAPTVHASALDAPGTTGLNSIDPHTQLGSAVADQTTLGGRLIGDNFDRFGGLTEDEFIAKHWDPTYENDYPPGTTGRWRYPEDNGAEGIQEIDSGHVRFFAPGAIFDRFGDEYGKFISPEGALFGQRALPPSALDGGYHRYVVLRPLDSNIGYARISRIARAFEQEGGAIQLQLPDSVRALLKSKHIKEIMP